MSEWVFVTIIGIVAAYKLIEQWIDSREHRSDTRESDTYSTTETSPHDIRDDSESRIPDVRLGFQKE